jgi:phosphoserine phosphatase RsbX
MDLGDVRATVSIDWAVASRPIPGEPRSGDRHVVREVEDGLVIAVFDGLGHGGEAAFAAAMAADVIEHHAEEPVERLAVQCHEQLRKTRGVVMGLARLTRAGSLTWLAIGDVEGVVVPDPDGDGQIRSLPQHRGIAGFTLPPLNPEAFELRVGDLLLMATDGIRPDGLRRRVGRSNIQWLANDILVRSARENDDALVLVVTYGGPS